MKITEEILMVDCQVFQTPSWHRGMGKYSLAFLGAVLERFASDKTYEFQFLFNSGLKDNDEATAYIRQRMPNASFLHIDLCLPQEPRTENSIQPVIESNKDILNSFLEEKFASRKVNFLILALYLDEVCSVFPDTATEKMLVYYDSIPYLYHQRYGQFKGFFENFYMPHTATVYEASKLLTISKTVANDLHLIFGLPAKNIFNIDGASIPRESANVQKPSKLEIKANNFVLLPTGQELRKNNTRAVRAFEQFCNQKGSDIKLVISSHFTQEAQDELTGLSRHVIFSGNVSEDEMLWLFQNCKFVLFPSEYEGLGLPILEAVEQGKAIACSDISVFREMSSTAFDFFDPLNIDSIAETLAKVDKESTVSNGKKESYLQILEKYSWPNTVRLFVDALNKKQSNVVVKRKKIAIFCPHPTGFSAIGKVIIESHAWYARYFDITYYFDKGPNHEAIRPDPLPFLAPCYNAEDFTVSDYEAYDAVVYHIGNSEYHLNIIHTALAFPGVIVLHDTYLAGAYDNLIEQGYISRQRFDLEKKLDLLLPDLEKLPTSTWLASLVNNQRAVVTHSKYAENAVRKKIIRKDITVQKINLPVDTPLFTDIVRSFTGKLNVSFAGIIAKVKGTDIIERIALSQEFNGCNINIFGYSAVEPERLEALKALPHVRLVTNPSDYEFQKLMADTDILINVRLAYKGETSLTTLEAMRYGGVVMVRDFGWYSELPDNTVLKVQDPAQVLMSLADIVGDRERIDEIKKDALSYIHTQHSHEEYAKKMYELLNQL